MSHELTAAEQEALRSLKKLVGQGRGKYIAGLDRGKSMAGTDLDKDDERKETDYSKVVDPIVRNVGRKLLTGPKNGEQVELPQDDVTVLHFGVATNVIKEWKRGKALRRSRSSIIDKEVEQLRHEFNETFYQTQNQFQLGRISNIKPTQLVDSSKPTARPLVSKPDGTKRSRSMPNVPVHFHQTSMMERFSNDGDGIALTDEEQAIDRIIPIQLVNPPNTLVGYQPKTQKILEISTGILQGFVLDVIKNNLLSDKIEAVAQRKSRMFRPVTCGAGAPDQATRPGSPDARQGSSDAPAATRQPSSDRDGKAQSSPRQSPGSTNVSPRNNAKSPAGSVKSPPGSRPGSARVSQLGSAQASRKQSPSPKRSPGSTNASPMAAPAGPVNPLDGLPSFAASSGCRSGNPSSGGPNTASALGARPGSAQSPPLSSLKGIRHSVGINNMNNNRVAFYTPPSTAASSARPFSLSTPLSHMKVPGPGVLGRKVTHTTPVGPVPEIQNAMVERDMVNFVRRKSLAAMEAKSMPLGPGNPTKSSGMCGTKSSSLGGAKSSVMGGRDDKADSATKNLMYEFCEMQQQKASAMRAMIGTKILGVDGGGETGGDVMVEQTAKAILSTKPVAEKINTQCYTAKLSDTATDILTVLQTCEDFHWNRLDGHFDTKADLLQQTKKDLFQEFATANQKREESDKKKPKKKGKILSMLSSITGSPGFTFAPAAKYGIAEEDENEDDPGSRNTTGPSPRTKGGIIRKRVDYDAFARTPNSPISSSGRAALPAIGRSATPGAVQQQARILGDGRDLDPSSAKPKKVEWRVTANKFQSTRDEKSSKLDRLLRRKKRVAHKTNVVHDTTQMPQVAIQRSESLEAPALPLKSVTAKNFLKHVHAKPSVFLFGSTRGFGRSGQGLGGSSSNPGSSSNKMPLYNSERSTNLQGAAGGLQFRPVGKKPLAISIQDVDGDGDGAGHGAGRAADGNVDAAPPQRRIRAIVGRTFLSRKSRMARKSMANAAGMRRTFHQGEAPLVFGEEIDLTLSNFYKVSPAMTEYERLQDLKNFFFAPKRVFVNLRGHGGRHSPKKSQIQTRKSISRKSLTSRKRTLGLQSMQSVGELKFPDAELTEVGRKFDEFGKMLAQKLRPTSCSTGKMENDEDAAAALAGRPAKNPTVEWGLNSTMPSMSNEDGGKDGWAQDYRTWALNKQEKLYDITQEDSFIPVFVYTPPFIDGQYTLSDDREVLSELLTLSTQEIIQEGHAFYCLPIMTYENTDFWGLKRHRLILNEKREFPICVHDKMVSIYDGDYTRYTFDFDKLTKERWERRELEKKKKARHDFLMSLDVIDFVSYLQEEKKALDISHKNNMDRQHLRSDSNTLALTGNPSGPSAIKSAMKPAKELAASSRAKSMSTNSNMDQGSGAAGADDAKTVSDHNSEATVLDEFSPSDVLNGIDFDQSEKVRDQALTRGSVQILEKQLSEGLDGGVKLGPNFGTTGSRDPLPDDFSIREGPTEEELLVGVEGENISLWLSLERVLKDFETHGKMEVNVLSGNAKKATIKRSFGGDHENYGPRERCLYNHMMQHAIGKFLKKSKERHQFAVEAIGEEYDKMSEETKAQRIDLEYAYKTTLFNQYKLHHSGMRQKLNKHLRNPSLKAALVFETQLKCVGLPSTSCIMKKISRRALVGDRDYNTRSHGLQIYRKANNAQKGRNEEEMTFFQNLDYQNFIRCEKESPGFSERWSRPDHEHSESSDFSEFSDEDQGRAQKSTMLGAGRQSLRLRDFASMGNVAAFQREGRDPGTRGATTFNVKGKNLNPTQVFLGGHDSAFAVEYGEDRNLQRRHSIHERPPSQLRDLSRNATPLLPIRKEIRVEDSNKIAQRAHRLCVDTAMDDESVDVHRERPVHVWKTGYMGLDGERSYQDSVHALISPRFYSVELAYTLDSSSKRLQLTPSTIIYQSRQAAKDLCGLEHGPFAVSIPHMRHGRTLNSNPRAIPGPPSYANPGQRTTFDDALAIEKAEAMKSILHTPMNYTVPNVYDWKFIFRCFYPEMTQRYDPKAMKRQTRVSNGASRAKAIGLRNPKLRAYESMDPEMRFSQRFMMLLRVILMTPFESDFELERRVKHLVTVKHGFTFSSSTRNRPTNQPTKSEKPGDPGRGTLPRIGSKDHPNHNKKLAVARAGLDENQILEARRRSCNPESDIPPETMWNKRVFVDVIQAFQTYEVTMVRDLLASFSGWQTDERQEFITQRNTIKEILETKLRYHPVSDEFLQEFYDQTDITYAGRWYSGYMGGAPSEVGGPAGRKLTYKNFFTRYLELRSNHGFTKDELNQVTNWFMSHPFGISSVRELLYRWGYASENRQIQDAMHEAIPDLTPDCEFLYPNSVVCIPQICYVLQRVIHSCRIKIRQNFLCFASYADTEQQAVQKQTPGTNRKKQGVTEIPELLHPIPGEECRNMLPFAVYSPLSIPAHDISSLVHLEKFLKLNIKRQGFTQEFTKIVQKVFEEVAGTSGTAVNSGIVRDANTPPDPNSGPSLDALAAQQVRRGSSAGIGMNLASPARGLRGSVQGRLKKPGMPVELTRLNGTLYRCIEEEIAEEFMSTPLMYRRNNQNCSGVYQHDALKQLVPDSIVGRESRRDEDPSSQSYHGSRYQHDVGDDGNNFFRSSSGLGSSLSKKKKRNSASGDTQVQVVTTVVEAVEIVETSPNGSPVGSNALHTRPDTAANNHSQGTNLGDTCDRAVSPVKRPKSMPNAMNDNSVGSTIVSFGKPEVCSSRNTAYESSTVLSHIHSKHVTLHSHVSASSLYLILQKLGFGSGHLYNFPNVGSETLMDFYDVLRWIRNFLVAERHLLRELFTTYYHYEQIGRTEKHIVLKGELLNDLRTRAVDRQNIQLNVVLLKDPLAQISLKTVGSMLKTLGLCSGEQKGTVVGGGSGLRSNAVPGTEFRADGDNYLVAGHNATMQHVSRTTQRSAMDLKLLTTWRSCVISVRAENKKDTSADFGRGDKDKFCFRSFVKLLNKIRLEEAKTMNHMRDH